MYSWNLSILWHYKQVFLEGALVTLWLALLSIICGTLLGAILAIVKGGENPVFSWLAHSYVKIFRALPTLVVLIWIYYALPGIIGLRLSPFIATVVTLSLHLSAFVPETIRSAIESIPKGQLESGLALGMTQGQTMRRIIVPQAIRTMIPNLFGLYITEIKNSSLASVIGVNEILHRSNIVISETYRPLEIYTGVALIYAAIIIPLMLFAQWYERRFSTGISYTPLHYGSSTERT